jgi:hypothetical protein
MKNKDITFPYYSGNIYRSESLGRVNLEYFINAIKNPKPEFKSLFDSIEKATKDKDTALKRSLKQQLFSFTPTIVVPKGSKRKYDNILKFTGLMQLDFDCIETEKEAIRIKEHIFENYNEIVCAFLSPSRKGVKCLMRTEVPTSVDHYKAMHKAMESTFGEYGYLDLATKNAALTMFLSYDKNILYRDFSECEEWSQADYTKTVYVNLNNLPTTSNISLEDKDTNYKKVVRIITTRFGDILDNGHPQVRATALILGSRVAADYISQGDAENLALSLLSQNNYLQKNIRGYTKTILYAIQEGMKAPKYF